MSDQAQSLFRAAYENRYTWDADFPGYEAQLTLTQGEETYTAQIRVTADFQVEVMGIADETVKESVYNQMRDIITHRKRNSFEKAHGKNTFSLGDTDETGAIAIQVSGDAMGSQYKIRGQEICQVSRVMGPMAFTIDTHESFDTGAGYLSVGYAAIFREAATQALKGERRFRERYTEVGGYFLPSFQEITAIDPEGAAIVTTFAFDEMRLLQTAAV